MKQKLLLPFLAGLILSVSAGCKKIAEHIPKPPPPANDYMQCRISKITGSWVAGIDNEASWHFFKATLIFRYNSAGNPVSIGTQDTVDTQTPVEGRGWYKGLYDLPYRLFRYDQQNRLSDLIEPTNPNLSLDRGYRSWHRYAYDNANNIITDTTYGGGQEINGRPSNPAYSITTFNYDAQNRMLPPGPSVLFQGLDYYDARGNYAFRDDSIPYPYDTTTISMLQTNKIWMFLGMNYSKNVYHFTSDGQNPYFGNFSVCKLPAYFNIGNFIENDEGYLGVPDAYSSSIWATFFQLSWLEMNIEYDCSCNCGSSNTKLK